MDSLMDGLRRMYAWWTRSGELELAVGCTASRLHVNFNVRALDNLVGGRRPPHFSARC